jgi:hypothetical protein
MICPDCYGKGYRGSVCWDGTKICPECQGSGIAYCCDKAGANDLSDDPVAVTIADYWDWALRQPVGH